MLLFFWRPQSLFLWQMLPALKKQQTDGKKNKIRTKLFQYRGMWVLSTGTTVCGWVVDLTGPEIGHSGPFPQSQSAESDQQKADQTLGHSECLAQFCREEATANGRGGIFGLTATGRRVFVVFLLQPSGEYLLAVVVDALVCLTGRRTTTSV